MVQQIGIRVSEELREKLERLAAENDRKLSDYVRVVLQAHVEQKNKEKRQ
jgi:predicted DNA-binding protein